MERLGTVNIYNIDDHDCTPGSLHAATTNDYERARGLHDALAAKGMPLETSASSVQVGGLRSTAFDAARMRAQLHKPGYSTSTADFAEEPLRDLDACGGASFNVNYFNRPDVWAALNVDKEGPAASAKHTGWKWAECASRPLFNYTKTTSSHTALYQQHLVPEMRVTIFSGDVDACVPYLGTMRWVADVAANNGSGKNNTGGEPYRMIGNDWNSWTADENVAGYFTAWDVPNSPHNFTFATVKGAGHMVPETQPRAALALFYRFLHGLPMNFQEPSPLRLVQQPRLLGSTSSSGAHEALVGGSVTISVEVDGGIGPHSYQWFRDGTSLDWSFGSQLALGDLTGRDSGEYYCHITSGLGSTLTSEPFLLTVQPSVVAGGADVGTAEWLLEQHQQGGSAWWRWGLVCVVASATLTVGVVLGARRHRVGRLNTLRAGVLEMEESLYCGSKGDSNEQSPPVADRSWSSGSSAEVEVSTV